MGPNIPMWYHIGTRATTPTIQLVMTSFSDAIFDVFFGAHGTPAFETLPRISNAKLFTIPTGAGDWYVQVRTVNGDFITITATPGGAGPSLSC